MKELQIFFLFFISLSSSVKSQWFPKFGRLVEVPQKSHGRMKWENAVIRCHNIGGRPFIPKDKKEFQWMEMHHTEAGFNTPGGATMWFPATDRALEGRLIFTDGRGSETHGEAMLWRNNVVMQQNSDANDCVGYRTDNAAYMYNCDAYRYPMICEKDVDSTATSIIPDYSSIMNGESTTTTRASILPVYSSTRTDCIPLNSSDILSSLNGDPITLFASSSSARRYTGVIKVFYGPNWETARTLSVDLSRHAQQYSNGIMMLAIWPRFEIRLALGGNNIYTFYLTTNRSDSDRYDNFAYRVSEEELVLELSNMGDSIWYQNCYPVATTADVFTELATESTIFTTQKETIVESTIITTQTASIVETTPDISTTPIIMADSAANTLSQSHSNQIIIGITAILLLTAIAVVIYFWRKNAQNKDEDSGSTESDRKITYHNLKDENINIDE